MWSDAVEDEGEAILRCRKRAHAAISAAPGEALPPGSPERITARQTKQTRHGEGPGSAQLTNLKKLVASLLDLDSDVQQLGTALGQIEASLQTLPKATHQTFQQFCVTNGIVILVGTFISADYPLNVRLAATSVLKYLTMSCPPAKAQVTGTQVLADINSLLPQCGSLAMRSVIDTLHHLMDKCQPNKAVLVGLQGVATLLTCAAELLKDGAEDQLLSSIVNSVWLCIAETKAPDATEQLQGNNARYVELLISFLARPALRSSAAGIIGHLASLSPTISAMFGDARGTNVFAAINTILSGASDANDFQWTVYALGTLLQDCPSNIAKMHESSNIVNVLCRFLKTHGHESLQRLSAVALHHIVEHTRSTEHKLIIARHFISEGAFDSLAQLVLSATPVVSQAALLVIGALPHFFCFPDFLSKFNLAAIITSLVSLLGSTSNMIQIFLSTQAIANIMLFSQVTCRTISTEHPTVLRLMINLLDTSCSNVQGIACSVLCSSAAVRYENSNEIRKEGGIEKLVKLLNTPVVRLQSRVVGCLGSLAANSGLNKKLIRELDAIPTLVYLLKSPNQETHTIAAAALSNLIADSPPNQQLLLKYGGVAALVDNLASSIPDLRTWSIRALYNASKDNIEISTEIGRLGGSSILCQQILKLSCGKEFSMHQTLCG